MDVSTSPETALSSTHLQDHEILWMPQGEAVVSCSRVWMPLPHQVHGLSTHSFKLQSMPFPMARPPFKIPLPLRLMDQMISEPKASSSISVMQRCSPSIKSTCHSILLQGVFIKRYVKCSVASSCSDKGPKLASGTMTTALSFNK